MKKEYISDVWQLKQKGHENFEFVDVAVNDDNLLFIDPCLIERWNNAWAIKAMKHAIFMHLLHCKFIQAFMKNVCK